MDDSNIGPADVRRDAIRCKRRTNEQHTTDIINPASAEARPPEFRPLTSELRRLASVMDDRIAPSLAHSAHCRRSFSRQLLAWFRGAARDLPWRRTKDLYAIWVSEIMLQQTQVATVVPYYHRFLAVFPDVRSLSAAREEHVLRLWEGLGYYRRARQLHLAAQRIVSQHNGRFPATFDAACSLPGIGRYTAGAILSIGLGARLPILEANTIRVLSRLFAFRGATASTAGQKHLWSLAELILPARECGLFNQAMMELGSEICTPRAPACDRCPVARYCRARAAGGVEQIPTPAKRTKYEDVHEIAVVVRHGQRVLVRQCQPGQRWAGLWDFPRFTGNAGDIADQVAALTGERVVAGPLLTTLKHGVTRFRIMLDCYNATHRPARRRKRMASDAPKTRWVLPRELAKLPLSVTGRKLARMIATLSGQATRKTPPAAVPRRADSRHMPG